MRDRLKSLFKVFRYRLAYFIVPDWIGDLEERLSVFLWYQTGGLLSKPYYSTYEMLSASDEYNQRMCDRCHLVGNRESVIIAEETEQALKGENHAEIH